MSGVVPIIPRFKFTSPAGVPIAGGTVTVYLAGTTTLATTYQDKSLTTVNTNPVTLDANGECLFWVSAAYNYKFLLKDAVGATVPGWPVDNIPGAADIAGTIAAANAAVTASVDAAAASALAAETARAGAETALALCQALEADTPGTSVLALAGDGANILVFDSTETNTAYEARKVVAGAGTNGTLGSFIGNVWGLKMCKREDGTYAWNDHNIFRATNALEGASWVRSGLTVTTGQTDSDAGTSAFLLTSTASPDALVRQSQSTDTENWVTYTAIVRNGTAGFCWVSLFDGTTTRYAYFNLTTGAWATVDVGLTAAVSANRPNGTALPAGYKRISLRIKHAGSSTQCDIGPCDADASRIVTVGRTFYLEKPQLHYGKRDLEFVSNTSTSLAAYGAPYDYTVGDRRLYLEPATAYVSNYSEDLTQAEWVKTTMTAALSATGPSGEACSTLTSTGANATCLQIVAGGTARVANFFVRRKTGFGAVSITIDGGTWTDITESINTTTYTRFALAGGADSTFGFKLANSGDQIEVAHNLLLNHPLVLINDVIYRAPRPVYSSGSSHATIGDTFKLNSSLWTGGYAAGFSLYVDYDRWPGYAGYADHIPVSASKTAYTQYTRYTLSPSQVEGTMNTVTSTTDRTTYIYLPAAGERMEITMTSGGVRSVMSINGDPIATHGNRGAGTGGAVPDLGVPVVDFIELAALQTAAPGHSIFLRRLATSPNVVDPRDVRDWRYSGRRAVNWLTMHEVAITGEVANTQKNREPSVQIISDDGDVVECAVLWFQRHYTALQHEEMPARLMQRNYKYTKSTGVLQPTTEQMVAYQDDRWSSSIGTTHSFNIFQVPSGAYEGEWRAMFCQQDSVSGDIPDDNRSVYTMVNRRTDCHPSGWTTPVKVLDAITHLGGVGYVIPLSNCEPLMFPPDHSVAPGRVCIPLYKTGDAVCNVFYTDTYGGADGSDWTLGPNNQLSPALVASISNINEPTCSFWPDGNGTMGTAIYTWRCHNESPENDRVWGTSTDGINITYQGLIPGYQGSECSTGTFQLDPQGLHTGTNYGKIVFSRPEHRGSSSKPRNGMRIGFATGATMALSGEYFLFYRDRPFGYSSIKGTTLVDDTTGGPLCMFAVESGSNGGQTDSNVLLMVLPMPAW